MTQPLGGEGYGPRTTQGSGQSPAPHMVHQGRNPELITSNYQIPNDFASGTAIPGECGNLGYPLLKRGCHSFSKEG
jgi:hypothetical protein